MSDNKKTTNKRKAKASEAKAEEVKTPDVVQAPVSEAKKDDGLVSVKRSVLEQILAKQESQQAEIKRLTSTADVGRLSHYDALNNNGKLIRTAFVRTWKAEGDTNPDGSQRVRMILGWKMLKDEVGVDSQGVLREKQTIRLFLDDGEDKPLIESDSEYLYFSRNFGRMEGEITKESKGSDGETRTLEFESGRILEVDIRFLN